MKLLVAIVLLSCGQLGMQVFLPALPQIGQDLALGDADARQIIMLFYLSFGLSQLVYGPWSDIAGRRKVFVWGQLLFIVGSFLCYIADSALMLAMGRLLQGMGAGAPVIVSRVILSDSLQGERLSKALSSLAIAAGVLTVLAPLIGGWITTDFGWQALFASFTVYLILSGIVATLILPGTRATGQSVDVANILQSYGKLLVNKQFIACSAFKWVLTLLLLASSTLFPFALQRSFNLTAEQYGYWLMIPGLGLILGSILAKKAVARWSLMQIIALFCLPVVFAGLLLLSLAHALPAILLAFILLMMAAGGVYPAFLQLVVAPFPKQSGAVVALVGAIDMLVFSSLATVVNRYWFTTVERLGVLYLLGALTLAISWVVLNRARFAQSDAALPGDRSKRA